MKEGEISKSMGVDTKPAHRLEYKGHWILIDPKMDKSDLEILKNNLEKVEHLMGIAKKMRQLLVYYIAVFEAENDQREMDGYSKLQEPSWIVSAKKITNETIEL